MHPCEYGWIALRCYLLICFGEQISAQTRYSVPEEVKEGTVVGNIAKDLGIDVGTLAQRRFRLVSASQNAAVQVNQNNGVLYVQKKIDREELCDGNDVCLINLKIVVENPLEVHYVEIEIRDINDHSPVFLEKKLNLEIIENKAPGARFELPSARDLDVGINSVRNYKLTPNEHFSLELRDGGEEDRIPFLELRKSLDREDVSRHELILTAVDGGNPPQSGFLNISVTVLDTNDNQPVCSQDTYSLTLQENVAVGTVVMRINATDADDGLNGEIEYALGRNTKRKVQDVFHLDTMTGDIRVKGEVDFEENQIYRLNIQAFDKGQPPSSAACKVIIQILDMNDNEPDIELTSLSNMVPEDAKPGTVVSLVSVSDKDSGVNGKVLCSVSDGIPFELKPSAQNNMYSLVTKGNLDREVQEQYEITVTAADMGQPPLTTFKSLHVQLSDKNDNSPEFSRNPLELYLMENNIPGASIFSVSASDRDMNENALISYQILRGDGSQNDMTSFLNINSDNGNIYALKSFDFETTKNFSVVVAATDSGTPSLSSNVTVNVFILDVNDNTPMILSPLNTNGSAEAVEEIPRNVNAGHLVTKVRAYDADIGYNGWLLFSLQEVTDHNLFGLDRYTGQIRTLRSFTETDEAQHKLVIVVKDNGNVSLSATATVIIKAVEPKEAFAASDVKRAVKEDEESNVVFYLIITLGSISTLFVISIIVLIIMQCSKSTNLSSEVLQDTSYDGTLCHSIQYRSGDKRYMLVGPRMSIGSAIAPGSNATTLIVKDRGRRGPGEVTARFIQMNMVKYILVTRQSYN
ncbi:protocadherin alpha-8-like [Chanos chanos]|uniref:Protocadherin alpha-8-like n=1 Tax=Chanos chanos TaxID=29144 RepID=A0A6J2UMG2_CHACN|nr:protocadherin alpha-8-like [Chanos chanos]